MIKSLKNRILFGKYKITKEIGKGSFGSVFQGINTLDNSLVAIKIEKKNAKTPLLNLECNFLSILKGYGIPEVKSFGYHGNYNILVQELLGKNLMQIKYLINRFTLKDLAMIAIQIMDRIEFVHSKNIIHRDIKPENFVVGYKDNSTIYIIDFGISRKYRSSRKHLKFQLLGKMFGTVRYASYNASRGVEQSRRDDLESIGYMLIFLGTGKLPWKGINLKAHDRTKKYLEMLLLKKYTSNEVICNNLPKEFICYLNYCKSLSFEQEPDYEYLRNLFRNILLRMNTINDSIFTWTKRKKSSKDKDSNTNKYINFLRRKQSPQKRLFRAIQNSLEKNQKTNDEKYPLSGQKILIKENSNENIHIRGSSDEATQITKYDALDNNSFDKSEFSYNSLIAHFNMNVIGFQDEGKMYEENIRRINSIKNKKIIPSMSDLNSYNHNQNNKIKINQNKINKNNNNENILDRKNKSILNRTLILDKDILQIPSKIKNERRIKTEKIKSKFRLYLAKNNSCTKKEENRKLLCNNHLDSFIKIKNGLRRNNYIDKNNYYVNDIKKTKIIDDEQKNVQPYTEESFSFKNLTINKNSKTSEINDTFLLNKNNEPNKKNSNKIIKNNNNNMINIDFNEGKNKLNLKNIPKGEKFKDNHSIKNKIDINNLIGEKDIFKNNNNINIIINNNLNNFKNISQKNNVVNFSNYQTYQPYYKTLSNSQENMINMNIVKKNIYNENDNHFINDNINKIPRNNKPKIENKLIPNLTKPIKKNYFLQSLNNTLDNSNKNINTALNNQIKINNIPNIKKIKILEYKSLYNNNKTFFHQKCNSYKNIRSAKNQNPVYPIQMQIIQLNNKNKIKTSPVHYNKNLNNKNLFIGKNNFYHNINSNIDLHTYNIPISKIKFENNIQINNNRNHFIQIKNKRIMHHYSPINNKTNDNLLKYSTNKDADIIKLIKRRNNSNQSSRKCLNYDFNYIDEIESFNNFPKKYHNLNFCNIFRNVLI